VRERYLERYLEKEEREIGSYRKRKVEREVVIERG
jgi:hypothetical protein